MSGLKHKVAWNDVNAEDPKPFLGHSQGFRDKIATMSRSTVLVAYPVEVVRELSAKYSRWLVESGYALVGFLPVRVGCDLKDS